MTVITVIVYLVDFLFVYMFSDATPEDDISTVVANRKREEATIEVTSQGHVRFSVWISFAEIYQEQIYDLLAPPPKKKLSRRVQLHLREDRTGQPYVKGRLLLLFVCVCIATEFFVYSIQLSR